MKSSSRTRTKQKPALIRWTSQNGDYGFHPPTIYFPLVVEGAMLIEPTESFGRADLDAFVEAMTDIDREANEDAQLVIDAPHSTRIGRLDEAHAARKPILRWRPDMGSLSRSA
jgi:glycine dehydrogenase subunit 2